MGKFMLGAFEFELVAPSEGVYDAYIDIGRKDRAKGKAVLLASGIASPSQTDLSRIFADKPAWKRTIIEKLEAMAGGHDPIEMLEADPSQPGLVRYRVGNLTVAFKPADETLFDAFEEGAARSLSDASLVLVQACVVEPENITAVFETKPAYKNAIASLIAREAGLGMELIEKKQ